MENTLVPTKAEKPDFGKFSVRQDNGMIVVNNLRIPMSALQDNAQYGYGTPKGKAISLETIKSPKGEDKAVSIFFRLNLRAPGKAGVVDGKLAELRKLIGDLESVAVMAPSEAIANIIAGHKAELAKLDPTQPEDVCDPIVAELTAISAISAELGAKVRQGVLELLAEEKKSAMAPAAS